MTASGRFERLLPLAKRMVRAAALTVSVSAGALADGPAYGPELQGFDYPFPVSYFRFSSRGEAMDMAYMDVRPARRNGRTVVLLHGKNFCAATWDTTIHALSDVSYRVVAPDQVGFCKSTKPAHYPYSFQQLSENTRALLKSLGVEKITLMGHSTGGMLSRAGEPDRPRGLEGQGRALAGRRRALQAGAAGHSRQGPRL